MRPNLRRFAGLVYSASAITLIAWLVFVGSIPHVALVALAMAALLGAMGIGVDLERARSDRLGFWSSAAPPLALTAAAWFARGATPTLLLAAWLYFLLFALGGQRWWSWWSRLVLRRPKVSIKERLRREYNAISDMATDSSTLTKPAFDGLRRRIVALDQFRTVETQQFIDLAQAELLDWADRRDVPRDEADDRDRNITRLGTALWPPPSNGSPSDIHQR